MNSDSPWFTDKVTTFVSLPFLYLYLDLLARFDPNMGQLARAQVSVLLFIFFKISGGNVA